MQTDSVGHCPIYDLLQKVECFTAGNIHHHLSQWKSITSDPFVIDIVKSGLKLRFAEESVQKAELLDGQYGFERCILFGPNPSRPSNVSQTEIARALLCL